MAIEFDEYLEPAMARIMLLGTFHFQDAGLDRHKPQVDFDILSDRRQREVEEVVELLAAFEPTKIAVECRPERQSEIDAQCSAYCRGEFQLTGNEIDQLGFRLACRLGHERVYCVDVWGRHYAPDLDLDAYAREHGQEALLDEWWPSYEALLTAIDQLKAQRTVREHLRFINVEATQRRLHGAYLVDYFKLGEGEDYTGPDWVTGWYNRNLRIFANLQRITEAVDERILLIIGAGHLPILRHAVEASPEYELVDVAEYLGASRDQSSAAG